MRSVSFRRRVAIRTAGGGAARRGRHVRIPESALHEFLAAGVVEAVRNES
jgi:hypothetical protein